MTAQPTGHVMWSPDPIEQRYARHTIEDVLLLPADAPRVERHDGVMLVFAYDLITDHYQSVAGSDEELVLTKPFDIRLPLADLTP